MMKTVLELSLECGHKIQTLHLTKSEKVEKKAKP